MALGALHLALFVGVACRRLAYPFELEWMEGGAIAHVERILAGRSLYTAPTLEFVPFIYPPLYFYVGAAASWLLGVGFLPLRLVSLLAALGSLVVIGLHVFRESGSAFWGFCAAALFAACYRIGAAWLDLARVDSLFLFLLLVALHLLHGPARPRYRCAAGVCLALSFLTKQVALVAGLPLVAYAIWFERRRAVGFAASSLGLIGLSWLALDLLNGGWFTYYLRLPAGHGMLPHVLVTFWTRDLIAKLPVAVALGAWFLWSRTRRGPRGAQAYYGVAAAGMLGSSWLARLHPGGYANVLLPAYALLCLLAGLGGWTAVAALRERGWAELGLYTLVVAQLAALVHDPRKLIPTADDRAAGELCVRRLAEIDGDVLVPFHAYLAERAGKRALAAGNAGGDTFRAGETLAGKALEDELRRAIREQRFGAIVLDGSVLNSFTRFLPLFHEEIEGAYVLQGRMFARDDVFWPTTGARTRPEYVLVPSRRDDR